MLYHTVRLIEECDIKNIVRGPKARVRYFFHINRDEVEVDMSVYTTRIREYFDVQISRGGWKSSKVMISKNISQEGRRPECDIFLDIITEDDFQPPRDIWTSKCSSVRVVYTLIWHLRDQSYRVIFDKHNVRYMYHGFLIAYSMYITFLAFLAICCHCDILVRDNCITQMTINDERIKRVSSNWFSIIWK